ncbi:hypothetical protein B0O99DRAFT_597899 [Bisporella sp. PMI_857]|nr:hypothetical protein B0O99DRAFT_597899 [Bisporella sp. PMI_857]
MGLARLAKSLVKGTSNNNSSSRQGDDGQNQFRLYPSLIASVLSGVPLANAHQTALTIMDGIETVNGPAGLLANSPVTLVDFHKFASLITELREKVWENALPKGQLLYVKYYIHPIRKDSSNLSFNGVSFVAGTLNPRNPPCALLSVNHQSRKIALKHFADELELENHNGRTTIKKYKTLRYNAEDDVFMIEGLDEATWDLGNIQGPGLLGSIKFVTSHIRKLAICLADCEFSSHLVLNLLRRFTNLDTVILIPSGIKQEDLEKLKVDDIGDLIELGTMCDECEGQVRLNFGMIESLFTDQETQAVETIGHSLTKVLERSHQELDAVVRLMKHIRIVPLQKIEIKLMGYPNLLRTYLIEKYNAGELVVEDEDEIDYDTMLVQ